MQDDIGGGSASNAGRRGEEGWLRRCLAAAAFGVATVGGVAPAGAFCRTTTCDPGDREEDCTPDDTTGCVQAGLPLYWPEQCLSFGVQRDGSVKQRIDFETATSIIREAFRQWMGADCQGQHPSFRMFDVGTPYGGIICNEPEFNQNEPNANVWMFRDNDWPYTGVGSTLALTTITFEVPTGEILDADVEVNSFAINLSTSEDIGNNESDLLSIATHEAGHFLGLAHSKLPDATMNTNYSPGDLSFRTLEQDDVDGICEIYPPDRDVPECSSPRPRHGFTRYCADPIDPPSGCAVAPEEPQSSKTAFAGLSLVAVSLLRLRARRRVPR